MTPARGARPGLSYSLSFSLSVHRVPHTRVRGTPGGDSRGRSAGPRELTRGPRGGTRLSPSLARPSDREGLYPHTGVRGKRISGRARARRQHERLAERRGRGQRPRRRGVGMARATTRWQVECACPEIFSRRSPSLSVPLLPVLSPFFARPLSARCSSSFFAEPPPSTRCSLFALSVVRLSAVLPFTLRPADNARRRPPSTVPRSRDSALILASRVPKWSLAFRCLGSGC